MDRKEDLLNATLCDELLAHILHRLPHPLHRQTASLACKRWLHAHRSSLTSLRLSVPLHNLSFLSSITSFIHHYPHLSALTVSSSPQESFLLNPHTLHVVSSAIASACKLLRTLHFTVGPLDSFCLRRLANGCRSITSLRMSHLPVRDLPLLCEFKALKEIFLDGFVEGDAMDLEETSLCQSLQLESLSLHGITGSNSALGWLWRSCMHLKKLELHNCDGIGDGDAVSFMHCLQYLQELHLYRCRRISRLVLTLVAEHCHGLQRLTFYHGGDIDSLKQVLHKCQGLQILDLRLPLDLDSDCLAAIASNCYSLRSLRLHSCWLPGMAMQLLAVQIKSDIEELVLVECKAVDDSGTLCVLGQHLKKIKYLDLSENYDLLDKELIGMLASCPSLINLKLSSCQKLTFRTLEFISQRCPVLQSIDIAGCDKINTAAVSRLLSVRSNLKSICVDSSKVTDEARKLAFVKNITFMESTLSIGTRQSLI